MLKAIYLKWVSLSENAVENIIEDITAILKKEILY